jgi:uncharacterized protein YggT (Ycf19 family)
MSQPAMFWSVGIIVLLLVIYVVYRWWKSTAKPPQPKDKPK